MQFLCLDNKELLCTIVIIKIPNQLGLFPVCTFIVKTSALKIQLPVFITMIFRASSKGRLNNSPTFNRLSSYFAHVNLKSCHKNCVG